MSLVTQRVKSFRRSKDYQKWRESIIKRDNNLISIRNYDYLNNFENQTVVSITGKPSSDEDTFIIPFCNDLKKILSKVENLIPFT